MNIDTAIDTISKPATIKFRLVCLAITAASVTVALSLILPGVHANAVKRANTVHFATPHVIIENPDASPVAAPAPAAVVPTTVKVTTTVPAPVKHVQQVSNTAPVATTATTTPGMPPEPIEQQKNIPGPFEACESMSTECDMDHDYIDVPTTEVKLAEQP